MFFILKSKINSKIKKEKLKTEKQVRAEERASKVRALNKKDKEHSTEIELLKKRHISETSFLKNNHGKQIGLYKKALESYKLQHELDVKAYSEYKEDKAFFRNFHEIHAPIIDEAMKIIARFRYQLNEGDRKEAISSQHRDSKTETKLKIVGAR